MILRSSVARTWRPHWSACPCLIPAFVRYRVSNSHILHGAYFSSPVKYRISKSYILQVLVSDPDPQKSNSSILARTGFQNCIVQACHSWPVRPGPPKITFLDLSSDRELYFSKLYRSGLPLPARQFPSDPGPQKSNSSSKLGPGTLFFKIVSFRPATPGPSKPTHTLLLAACCLLVAAAVTATGKPVFGGQ